MNYVLEFVHKLVWGVPALSMILGVGFYFTVRTGCAQISLFPRALRNFFTRLRPGRAAGQGVSSFQALCTALAATVGTGNIAGVAGAVAIGGPGAVFWMWISALLGMMTKLAEVTLAIRYREPSGDGSFMGGPMYIIRNGMGTSWSWLAVTYAFLGVVAAFGIGNATQINAVISSVNCTLGTVGIEKTPLLDFVIGIFFAGLSMWVLLGGAKRIGAASEVLVPVAALAYIGLCSGVLICNATHIPAAFQRIMQGAFAPRAVTGGVIGSALTSLRVGVSRGAFTNEAGMGTASIAHATAETGHPAEQGLMGIVEVFLDTIVICTMTALVILCSPVQIVYGLDEGAVLTVRAFSCTYGPWVSAVISLFLCCFAFATMLGWSFYGIRCAQYLFGAGCWKPFVCVQALVVVLSTLLSTGTVWLLSEVMNGLMAIPNLIALAALSPELCRLIVDYRMFLRTGSANGGTYESFNQRQSVRTFSYAEIPSLGDGRKKEREEDLSLKHRPA